MKRIRTALVVLLSISILSVGCGAKQEPSIEPLPEEKKLVVYTSHKAEIYEPFIQEFEDRTGIWVEVYAAGSNEILEKVASEADKPEADVVFGGGADSLHAYTSYFEPYQVRCREQITSEYAPADDSFTLFSEFPIVFVYNKKLVFSAGTPQGWSELLEGKWKGKIAFANPANSGSAYTALCTMLSVCQDQKDRTEVMERFAGNLNGELCKSSAEVMDEVISGSRAVGITTEDEVKKYEDQGMDIGIVYPKDGTAVVPDGTAIVKGAKHMENAKLFLEFTVCEDAQNLIQEYGYRRSIRDDLKTDLTVNTIRYDMDWAQESREEILKDFEDAFSEKEVQP
jgi:iron(III) transport system substrate-binding protein